MRPTELKQLAPPASSPACDPYSYAQLPAVWCQCHGQMRSYVIPKTLETATAAQLYHFLLEGDLDDRVGVLIDTCLCSDWPVNELLRCFFRLRRTDKKVIKSHFDDIFDLLNGHLYDVLQRCDVAAGTV